MSTVKLLSPGGYTSSRLLLSNYAYGQIFQSFRRGYKTRLERRGTIAIPTTSFRYPPSKHFSPKFAHMRVKKAIHVDLSSVPNYERSREEKAARIDPEEIRSMLKKKGMPPARPYRDRGRDRPIHVSSTGGIMEAYVPPEGDGRASRLSREGVGQLWEQISSKSRELVKHVRTVRRYDEEFDPKTFGETVALPVFIEAHDALMERDKDRLHEFVTEHAFAIMEEENRLRSFRWEMIESIEPARVVHVRASGALHADDIFGQVTVRMHTKQKLAIYDQFGRLFLGSNEVARDVLEYVVFERHLVNPYGSWRLHDKIVPSWLPPKQSTIRTFRKKEKPKMHDVGEDEQAQEFVPLPDEGMDKLPEKKTVPT